MALPFALPARVIVRHVADTYADCLRTDRSVAIDVAAARAQHARYVQTLVDLGVPIEALPGDAACPDGCFVEDAAVVLDRVALSTRPGAAARRAEIPAVARALEAHRVVHAMSDPATLDGGDVMRVGPTLFVGLSTRTNAAGVERLRAVAALDDVSVIAVEVTGGLHLKSACTLASPTTLVYDAELLGDASLAPFRAAGLDCLAADESAGANVLALGNAVLVSAAAPRTAARLARLGLDVRPIDVGEMHKGDGALTCLSLRIAAPGAWCT